MSGRTLYLLRHAKSSWDDPALPDFDRPLDRRGAREAAEVARVLEVRGIRPARVLCSPSRRTRETLAALLGWLGSEVPVAFERRIYEASADDLLALLRAQPDDSASILMIGHNPGFEDLARGLAGDGGMAALKRLHRKYPPAGLATIAFAGDAWDQTAFGSGRLVAFDTPEH